MPITYNELLRRVPIWLFAENRNLVTEMPAIIEAAEDELWLRLDHDLFRTVLSATTVGNNTYNPDGSDDVIDLSSESPSLLEVRSIRLQRVTGSQRDWVPLHRRDVETLTTLYSASTPGTPRFYAEDEGYLKYRVYPYPVKEFTIQVFANQRPPALGVAQQTNAMTDQFPRAVEKAVLRQGALFMKDANSAGVYENEMMQAINEANMQVARRRRDDTAKRPIETTNARGG